MILIIYKEQSRVSKKLLISGIALLRLFLQLSKIARVCDIKGITATVSKILPFQAKF